MDILLIDQEIRDGHKSMGREAEDTGRELALLAPRTMAAAVWGAAVTTSSDKDVQALAAQGALAAPFGVARCWAAVPESAGMGAHPSAARCRVEVALARLIRRPSVGPSPG